MMRARGLGVAAIICGLLSAMGCPERPPRYRGDIDAGPVVYDDEQIADWDHCPPRNLMPAEAGHLWVQATSTATYCATPSTASPIETFETKYQLRLVPADWFLPLDDGAHAVRVATCDQTRHNGVVGNVALDATWTVERESVLGTPTFTGTLVQPYPDGTAIRMRVTGLDDTIPRYSVETGGGILLDGAARSPRVAPAVTFARCSDATCTTVQGFSPCALPKIDEAPALRDLVHLSIERGELDFFFDVTPDTDELFSIVRRADGEFRGEAVTLTTASDVDAYWPVTMTRFGNSSRRDFIFKLDPPIDDVCFLEFTRVRRTNSDFDTQVFQCGATNGEFIRSIALSYDDLQ